MGLHFNNSVPFECKCKFFDDLIKGYTDVIKRKGCRYILRNP